MYRLKRIINRYGVLSQVDKAIEEMAELEKALLKHRWKKSQETLEGIIDEIADVQIMVEQLKIMYDCHKEVAERIEYKINRQLERIASEECDSRE